MTTWVSAEINGLVENGFSEKFSMTACGAFLQVTPHLQLYVYLYILQIVSWG